MPRGKTFDHAPASIGDTPMIRINRLVPAEHATVFAKCEFFQPLNSVKDRIGVAMIEAAGLVRPGGTLVYSVCTLTAAESSGVVDAVHARLEALRYRVARPLEIVLFPAMSKVQHDTERLRRAYNSALMLVAARLRHIAGTRWGLKRYLNMDLLREMELEKKMAVA